ncbi:hypothetical protein IFM89_039214 [Coptis chinensis]|uniref:Uncharacterized protein n=1 Tax=Coptis chinensis TaxID=261450 RepID=A0A835HHK3_9MAGN|nr:hypothetical protein IFM89_039214 [Coptis chinensis]
MPKEVMIAQLQLAYDWVKEKYALAGEKYEEALKIKPNFYEGLFALGHQHFETAKLQWSFTLANKVDLETWDPTETIKLFNNASRGVIVDREFYNGVYQLHNCPRHLTCDQQSFTALYSRVTMQKIIDC